MLIFNSKRNRRAIDEDSTDVFSGLREVKHNHSRLRRDESDRHASMDRIGSNRRDSHPQLVPQVGVRRGPRLRELQGDAWSDR